MIPTIEERSKRPCNQFLKPCMHFDEGYEMCKIHGIDTYYKRSRMLAEKYGKGNPPYPYCKESEIPYIEAHNIVAEKIPCKYNMYTDEFVDMIDGDDK